MLYDTKKPENKYLERYKTLASQTLLTEREILNLKSVISGGKGSLSKEERLDLLCLVAESEHEITPEQSAKGIAWLKNLAWTPYGKPRKSDPFGYRERSILLGFTHFTFSGFVDLSGYGQDTCRALSPLYRVHGQGEDWEGSFEYIMRGGKIEIVG